MENEDFSDEFKNFPDVCRFLQKDVLSIMTVLSELHPKMVASEVPEKLWRAIVWLDKNRPGEF